MNVKAKICGLSTPKDVAAATSNGASFLGFNFYDKSPRYVSLEQIEELSEDVPSEVNRVVLCVDANDQTLDEIVKNCDPHYVQLHGAESQKRVRQIRDRLKRPLIKAVQISTAQDVEQAHQFESDVDILLFDAKPPLSDKKALPGGNAKTFDWALLAGHTWECPWMLSGGLTKENVKAAVQTTGARIVDVSSGIESSRGVKDSKLIEEFLETVGRL